MKTSYTLSLTALVLVGCARHYVPASDESYLNAMEAPPAQAPVPKTKAGAKGAEPTPVKAENTKRDLLKYVLRLSDPAAPYTPEDEQVWQELPKNPAHGSFQEAAIAVGVIRASLSVSEPQFKEQDIHQDPGTQNSAPAQAPQERSLESMTAMKGLVLHEALERNIMLRSHRVYRLALRALQNTRNSEGFYNKVSEVIQAEAQQWASLIQTPQGEAAVESPDGVQLPSLPGTRYSPADLRQGDATLVEAERLADEGAFKQAIDKASSIKDSDPFFPTAQEKIRTYSNRAVQTLRQKAAEAFQNSLPISDPREKVALLEEAQRHLEEALTQFPQAEQLDTVRENLAVISGNLEKIKK